MTTTTTITETLNWLGHTTVAVMAIDNNSFTIFSPFNRQNAATTAADALIEMLEGDLEITNVEDVENGLRKVTLAFVVGPPLPRKGPPTSGPFFTSLSPSNSR